MNLVRHVGELLGFLLLALACTAAPASAEFVRRDVLAISNAYQRGIDASEVETRRLAETPLNHLGLHVIHHDWSRSREPQANDAASVRGALVWFGGRTLDDVNRFLTWAIDFLESGRYIVMVGEPAFLRDESHAALDQALLGRFLELLGVDIDAAAVLDDFDPLSVVHMDPAMVGYERQLPPILETVVRVSVHHGDSEVYLAIGDSTGERSDVVARTIGGAIAMGPYAHVDHPASNMGYWLIDPLRFLADGFRMRGIPAPDTTTLTGRRLYFSYVDGDGWNDISSVADGNGVRGSAAAVMLNKLIKQYPDLPVTVAPITADLDLSMFGGRQSIVVARRIFHQSNVELASHTHTHPYDWDYFRPDDYDPFKEQVLFGESTAAESLLELRIRSLAATVREAFTPNTHHITNYRGHSRQRPRMYYDGPYDVARDIDQSIDILESMAPKNKRVAMVVWPGDGEPFSEALFHVRKRGLVSLGNANSRFDEAFPSLTYVSPISHMADGELQVLAPMADELFYTVKWPDRYAGFRDLISTIKNTDQPVRLRPVAVHYRIHSADRQTSLDAIRSVLDYASSLSITPVTASQYVRIVRGAFGVRIEKRDQGWVISERGGLNTLRFDDHASSVVDYDLSVGVLGHRHRGEVLYVALDPSVAAATVVLAPAGEPVNRPYLIDSRWSVRNATYLSDGVAFEFAGFGHGEMHWRFPHPCWGTSELILADNTTTSTPVESDSEGIVTTEIAFSPVAGARLTISCMPFGIQG